MSKRTDAVEQVFEDMEQWNRDCDLLDSNKTHRCTRKFRNINKGNCVEIHFVSDTIAYITLDGKTIVSNTRNVAKHFTLIKLGNKEWS